MMMAPIRHRSVSKYMCMCNAMVVHSVVNVRRELAHACTCMHAGERA